MLPPDASSNHRIGMWGTSRSGKTTYLAMLYYQLLSDPDWDVLAADSASQLFAEQAYFGIFQEQVFPEKTVQASDYTYYVTRLARSGQPERTLTLQVHDAAGELFEKFHDRARRAERVQITQATTEPQLTARTPQQMFERLRDCDSLMLFIDPLWPQRRGEHLGYGELLYQLFEELRLYRGGRNNMPRVALCITKVDGADDLWQESQTLDTTRCFRGELPEKRTADFCAGACPVFKLLGRPLMFDRLPGLVPDERVRCFTVSSIGRVQAEAGRWLPNISSRRVWQRRLTPAPPPLPLSAAPLSADLETPIKRIPTHASFEPQSISDPNHIQPLNIIEPLRWLIDFVTK